MYAVVWYTIYEPEFTILLGLVTFKYMCSYFIFEKRTERCCRIHEWHLKSPISKHINILQNSPYYTNLQLKIKKFRGGGCILNAKYKFKQYLITNSFRKYPRNPKFDYPLQKFLGTGLGSMMVVQVLKVNQRGQSILAAILDELANIM